VNWNLGPHWALVVILAVLALILFACSFTFVGTESPDILTP
jgi:hypothetical protein